MSVAAHHEHEGSPLQTIILITGIVGLLGYFAYSYAAGSDNTFFQVGAAVALLAYILTFVDVTLGIAIMFMALAVSPELSVAGVVGVRMEDFIVPALLLAWLTRTLGKHEPFAESHVKGPMFLYLLSMGVSSLFALSSGQKGFDMTTSFFFLSKNFEYFLIYLILANNVRTKGEFKALAVFALLTSLLGAFFALKISADMAAAGMGGRLQGPLGETANIFGGFLTINICFSVSYFFHARTAGQRIASAAAASILFYALLFTYSRTSYAALAGGIAVFGILKSWRMLVVLLILFVIFTAFAPTSILERASTISSVVTDQGPESWQARVEAWRQCMEKFWIKPILGYGIGSVALGDVDNEVFRILVDTGIVGLLCFLWLMIRIGRKANEAYDSITLDPFARAFTGGFMMAYFALLVHAFGATSFTTIRTMECFMGYAGMMICLYNHRQEWGLMKSPASESSAGESLLLKESRTGF